MSNDFLGKGWKAPLKLDDQGKIVLSEYEEHIKEAIWTILSTAPGERLMHSDFGCGIHECVFALHDTRTAGLVRFHVEEALTRWEPRIDLMEIRVQSHPENPAVMLIDIDYQVRTTDNRFNLVYPFYLERG